MEIRENYLKHSETTPSCDGLLLWKVFFDVRVFWAVFSSAFVGNCADVVWASSYKISFRFRIKFNIIQLRLEIKICYRLLPTETFFTNFPSNPYPTSKSLPMEFQIKIKGYRRGMSLLNSARKKRIYVFMIARAMKIRLKWEKNRNGNEATRLPKGFSTTLLVDIVTATF